MMGRARRFASHSAIFRLSTGSTYSARARVRARVRARARARARARVRVRVRVTVTVTVRVRNSHLPLEHGRYL